MVSASPPLSGMPIESVLDFAHTLATGALRTGGVAIDATVGNGHDTVALAQAVGAEGTVHGFDVQATALDRTRERLASVGLADRVQLHHAGHEKMTDHLPERLHDAIGAVTFNLGYLPGSESTVTTAPETTIAALDATERLLRSGGVATVVLYTGHEGGAAEAEAVDAWAAQQPQERLQVLSYRFVNQRNNPPRLLALEKQSTAGEDRAIAC